MPFKKRGNRYYRHGKGYPLAQVRAIYASKKGKKRK